MRQLVGCDQYVAVSRFTEQMLVSFGIAPERVKYIPYGIPHAPTPNPKRVAAIREQLLRNPSRDFLVVVSARLHYQKGHDVLLRAIPSVLNRIPDVTFAFVGDGPQRRSLRLIASALEIEDHVRFVGVQRNVNPFLHAADIFCLPSRYEALPLAIPEAYRAGLPVITSAVGGCPEIVRDGVTGLLVMPERPEALADALVRLLKDDSGRQRMGTEAKQYGFSDRFDADRRHAQIVDLYEQVLTYPAGRPPGNRLHRVLSSLRPMDTSQA